MIYQGVFAASEVVIGLHVWQISAIILLLLVSSLAYILAHERN